MNVLFYFSTAAQIEAFSTIFFHSYCKLRIAVISTSIYLLGENKLDAHVR